MADKIQYKPFGPIKSLRHGNGVFDDFYYDKRYLLKKRDTYTAGRQGVIYDSYSVNRDGNGNITMFRRNNNPIKERNQNFNYDALNRLSRFATARKELSPSVLEYEYDFDDNRLAELTTGEEYYYADDDQLDGVTSPDFHTDYYYTPYGEMDGYRITDLDTGEVSGLDFVYYANGRLGEVYLPNGQRTAQFGYDHTGKRKLKQAGDEGLWTLFFYDRAGRMLNETILTDRDNDTDNVIVDYIWLGDKLLAMGPGFATGGCFVATAAMGSSMTAELGTLRALRDRLLLRFDAGRAFVKYYYTHGPRWAKALEANPRYKPLVRTLLWPVVLTCRVAFFSDAFDKVLIVFLIVLFAALVLRSRKLFRTRLRKGFGVTIVVVLVVMCYGITMDVQQARASDDELEEVEPAYLTGDLYHFHEDHIGRPFIMTDTKEDDSNPDMVWYADFYAFGEVMYEVGSIEIGDVTTTGINYQPAFRFPGQYEDEETGLVYNWNRYYIPEIGRYNRLDPAVSQDHLYAYASNNPIIYIDPLGLATYKGTCVYVSGGVVGGLGWLSCDVYGQCNKDNKQQVGKLKAFFSGATFGLPLGGVGFSLSQSDSLPNIGNISNMGGSATLASASGSALIGISYYNMRLGGTVSKDEKYGAVQEGAQAGIDASMDLFYGYSWLSEVKEKCCDNPGGWK